MLKKSDKLFVEGIFTLLLYQFHSPFYKVNDFVFEKVYVSVIGSFINYRKEKMDLKSCKFFL